MFQSKSDATFIGLIAYLLVVLAPPLAKLAGWRLLATVSWQKATVLLWGPWVLLVVVSLLTFLVRLAQGMNCKIKI